MNKDQNPRKRELLQATIEHIDIKAHDVVPMVDAMGNMAFQARNLSRGARIFNMMQEDKDCAVFLTLAGSLFRRAQARDRGHDQAQHGGRHRVYRRQHRGPGFL
jgi:hypothetical protein